MAGKNIEKRRRVIQRSMKLGRCICDAKLPCPCPLLREKDVCLCAGERLEIAAGPVRLTQLVEKTGCASKIDQATLKRVLGGIIMPADPRVIIGAPAGDDAGVFRAGEGKAWVQTVDVFSPCVDDPYLFGQIAAANSVSDIYAMGGVPMTALSIIGFPARELPDAIMSEIIRGGVDKMAEAGVAIIGGHSINDREIKAGFAVTGLIDPDRIMSNAAAKPGDALVLTKAIGTGIISFASQIDRLPPGRATGGLPASETKPLEQIGRSMAALNKAAAELMARFDAHACTDITGFGMMGHLASMASASGADLEITWDDVPLFDGVLECVAAGIVPGAVERNRESSQDSVVAADGVTAGMLDILFDAQTSGGLLVSLPPNRAHDYVRALHDAGVTAAAIVGRVVGEGTGIVHVRTAGRRVAPEAMTSGRSSSEEGSSQEAVSMSECCSHSGDSAPAQSGQNSGTGISEVQKKFQEFLRVANQPGALDAHTKQAIAIALSVLAKCEPCVRSHIAKAREKGFSMEEIDEAAWMAISFGGAPLMMFYNGIRKNVLGQ